MGIWVLIVVLYSGHGTYGFTKTFSTEESCRRAMDFVGRVNKDVNMLRAMSTCVEDSGAECVDKRGDEERREEKGGLEDGS